MTPPNSLFLKTKFQAEISTRCLFSWIPALSQIPELWAVFSPTLCRGFSFREKEIIYVVELFGTGAGSHDHQIFKIIQIAKDLVLTYMM